MNLPAHVRYSAIIRSATKTHESRFPLAVKMTVLAPCRMGQKIHINLHTSFQNRGILYFGTHTYEQEKSLPIIFIPHVSGELNICNNFFFSYPCLHRRNIIRGQDKEGCKKAKQSSKALEILLYFLFQEANNYFLLILHHRKGARATTRILDSCHCFP